MLGSLGLLGGVVALIGWAGWADLHPAPVIVVGLLVLVGGFVARTFVDEGLALIPLSILMMLGVAVSAVAAPHLDDGTGDRAYHPQNFEDVQEEYVFGVGNSSVDLRDVDFPPGVHAISVDMGIGHTKVLLPEDVNYEVVGDLEIGKVDVFGETGDGFGNRVEANDDLGSDTTIVLDLDMEIGHAEIRRG
ncbi:MAG: LiaF domain-containing protein [Acidimicrobiia bacterium]